jgi:hypothetical protein
LEHGQPHAIVHANIACLIPIQSMTAIPVRHWIEILEEVCHIQIVKSGFDLMFKACI